VASPVPRRQTCEVNEVDERTLRQFSFIVLSVAATVGIMMTFISLADALFSGAPIDLRAMIAAIVCGFGAWLLRRQ